MNFWAASEFYFSFPPQLILHLGQKGAKKQEMASNRLQEKERKTFRWARAQTYLMEPN